MISLQKSRLLACVLGLGLGVTACATDESGSGNGSNGSTGNDNSMDPAGNGGNGNGGANGNNANAGANSDGGTGGNASGGESNGTNNPPLSAACEGKVKPGVTSDVPSFSQETISKQAGAAYMHPSDLNGDGFDEYLLTSLSVGVDPFNGMTPPLDWGAAYVLSRSGGPADGDLGTWGTKAGFDKSKMIGCPNSSEMFDVDGDDVMDWVIGAGFLLKPDGKIVWMKGTADGSFGPVQEIAVPDTKCWYHITLPLDIDGDDDQDFVTSCHVGDVNDPSSGPSRVEWFENDGSGKFTSHAIGKGGGSLLSLRDLDADGDLDVVAPQFFGPESMVWYEQTGAKGTAWEEHLINNTTGRGFIVKFADMNGDGKVDMLYGNHNNEEAAAPNNVMGIYWFDLPAAADVRSLENWDAYKHTVYEGFEVFGSNNADSAGSPGMINVGDIDGDCDMDVTASGDGDIGLYLFLQQADGFEKVDLFTDDSNQNSGEQHMADLDGDGDLDIIWAVFGPSGIGQILGLDSHIYAFLQD